MQDLPKAPASSSPPVARSGAGDISERELSRERYTLQTTPTTRVQPAHPKKQLLSAPAPISKFTAKRGVPSPNLDKIRRCLIAYENPTPTRPVKIGPKAVSMEDLTPTHRNRRDEKDGSGTLRSPALHSVAEENAAAKVCRFMVIAAWRRRKDEVRCLRKTLEFQVSCSERLRIQVCALKSLLESDNNKVRLAMRELERLKQLLKEKELERAVLEREKYALENDVCAAEDRASELSIGWRNSRNELEGVRASAAVTEHALSLERAAHAEARKQRDDAYQRLSQIEEDLAQHEELLSTAEREVAALKRENQAKHKIIQQTNERLKKEKDGRDRMARECVSLKSQLNISREENSTLASRVTDLTDEVAKLRLALARTTEQLGWWPKPLTRMMGVARAWLNAPPSISDAVMWSMIPARHGC